MGFATGRSWAPLADWARGIFFSPHLPRLLPSFKDDDGGPPSPLEKEMVTDTPRERERERETQTHTHILSKAKSHFSLRPLSVPGREKAARLLQTLLNFRKVALHTAASSTCFKIKTRRPALLPPLNPRPKTCECSGAHAHSYRFDGIRGLPRFYASVNARRRSCIILCLFADAWCVAKDRLTLS